MVVDLTGTVATVKLTSCVLNASGPLCTTLDELSRLAETKAGGVITKSCTLLPRSGNPEPRYVDIPHGSIQSMGLPNPGYKAYMEYLPKLKAAYPDKPIIVSIAGLSLEDNCIMLKEMQKIDVDGIELNLSCPNIPGKPQTAYCFEEIERHLEKYSDVVELPFGLKLPPYFDLCHQETVADLIRKHSKIGFISCINSAGNVLAIDADSETTLIRPNNGFGGLSGACLKPIGLANVNRFRELLPRSISIMGVGGVATGKDVFEYLLAGADAVQIGTTLWKEGPQCISRIVDEVSDLMQKKQYVSCADVCHNIKVC